MIQKQLCLRFLVASKPPKLLRVRPPTTAARWRMRAAASSSWRTDPMTASPKSSSGQARPSSSSSPPGTRTSDSTMFRLTFSSKLLLCFEVRQLYFTWRALSPSSFIKLIVIWLSSKLTAAFTNLSNPTWSLKWSNPRYRTTPQE